MLPPGLKLNLGCGPVQPQGWVNVDGSHRAWLVSRLAWLDRVLVRLGVLAPTEFGPGTLYWDLRHGLPFANGAASCIYAGELWEHFEYADAARLTAECFRVLGGDGVLRVCVPDGRQFWAQYVRLVDQALAHPPEARDAAAVRQHVALFFQNICTRPIRWGFAGHFHRWQFDEVQLVDMLRTAGFVEVQRMAYHQSRIPDVASVERSNYLIVEGVRPRPHSDAS